MNTSRTFRILALLLLSATGAVAQSNQSLSGTLRERVDGDTTDVFSEHGFTVTAGQRVEIKLTSDDFDTVLEVVPPDGETFTNDDADDGTNSKIETLAASGGRWRARVKSFDGTGGKYSLEITLGAAGVVRELPAPSLNASDSMSAKGLRYVTQQVDVAAAGEMTLTMSAKDFAPLLIVVSPSGERFSAEATSVGESAVVEVPFAVTGSWRVIASQAVEGDPGPYTLRLIVAPASGAMRVETGALEQGDRQDVRGEYYDSYTVRSNGGSLVLELASTEFDSYLAARSPSGEWYRDDDSGHASSDARLELPEEAGNWTVIVTSFAPGATGRYRLLVVD